MNPQGTYWHFEKVLQSTIRVPLTPGKPIEMTADYARQLLELTPQELTDTLDEFSCVQTEASWQLKSIDLP